MNDLIQYLKSPELVVKVQEYFGIEYINKSLNKTHHYHGNYYEPELEKHSSSSSSCCYDEEDSLRRKIGNSGAEGYYREMYRIHKKFWYYLFLIGTELGDEIFYATFIPFWFWNIDGAVGRRVIFLWSIVMYIGTYFKIHKCVNFKNLVGLF